MFAAALESLAQLMREGGVAAQGRTCGSRGSARGCARARWLLPVWPRALSLGRLCRPGCRPRRRHVLRPQEAASSIIQAVRSAVR
jgi:hypothetical protein